MKNKPSQTRSSGRDKGKNVAPQTAKASGKTTEMKHTNEPAPATVPNTTTTAETAAAPPVIPDEILPESLGDIVEAMAQSKAKVEQLQGELEAERQRGQRLYTKFETMKNEYKITFEGGGDEEETDGRRKFSPEKNLKISAVRIISWAKEKGLDEAAAKERALTKTAERAKKKHNMSRLPDVLTKYIEINTPKVYAGEQLVEVTESSIKTNAA